MDPKKTKKRIQKGKYFDPIPNRALTLEILPGPDASLTELSCFALTFDGYKFHESFEKCAEVAGARLHNNLDNIRTCLFFEQRRFHQIGELPAGDDLAYIRSLVEMIRQYVISGKHLSGTE